MMDTAFHSENPRLHGIDHERLQREGHVRLNFETCYQITVLRFFAACPIFGTASGSAADARTRSIVDGDVCESSTAVETALGERNRNINVLTSEKLTNLGNSATFYSVLVEIGLVKPSP
jgi:hypothetical protein